MAATSAASASSFVALGDAAPASTPSIVTFGDPAPASAAKTVSSIVAMGEVAPEVTYEKVAAIPKKSLHGPIYRPLVIRGGIAGDAFAPAEPAKTAVEPAQQASASKDGKPAASDAAPANLPSNAIGDHRQ